MSRSAVSFATLVRVAVEVPSPLALFLRSPRGGLVLGLLLGAFDYVLLRGLGVTMRLGEHDATLAICGLFGLSFAGLGWAIGRLLAVQAALRASAAEVVRSQRRALQSEKLAEVGQLAAGVAHEVRNPLGVIRSAASMLLEDLPEGSEARRAGGFICEEVDRLNGVVRALLDYARPLAPRRETLTLAELGEAVRPRVEAALRARAATLRWTGSGALTGDPDLLTQALLTLIDNAVQAVDEGGVVEVQMHASPVGVELRVADDGPGVEPEVAARVFEPFFTTRAGGTGLGLAMAARVAEVHGGSLRLRHGAGAGPGGRGACFVLWLPAAQEGTP